jgi:glutamate-5-semialdehyde dehydrogenase
MNKIEKDIYKICHDAKKASHNVIDISTSTKNAILKDVVKLLKKNFQIILEANKKDLQQAKKNNLDNAKIDRLMLDESRINNIIKTIQDIIKLPDPVNKILYQTKRDNGLTIKRVATPIGVLLAIYESRPNVTADISALAIKSGNVVILKCGFESINTSSVIADIFRQAIVKNKVDINFVNFLSFNNRDLIYKILKLNNFIDVVIPRGGKSLIKSISENSAIPLFMHLDGNCHTYIHNKANFDKARKILINAKMRRVGICGATESLLIDKKISKKIIPLITDDLSLLKCEIRGDKDSIIIDKRIKLASEQDYYTEYLDKIISIKIVNDLNHAIEHITKYGSSHTESIITEDKKSAKIFLTKVNSAIVMHNASTQFADGGEFGFGSEVGIATGKLHARGPVGLEQLTTFKYVVESDFAIRK